MRVVQIAVPAKWKSKSLGDMVRRGIKRADKKDTQPGQQKAQQNPRPAARPMVREIVEARRPLSRNLKRPCDGDSFVGYDVGDSDVEVYGVREVDRAASKRRKADFDLATSSHKPGKPQKEDECQQHFSSLLTEQHQRKKELELGIPKVSDSDIDYNIHEELIAGLAECLTNGDDEVFRVRYPDASHASLKHGLKGLRDNFPAVFARYTKWVKGGSYMPEGCEETCCSDVLGSTG